MSISIESSAESQTEEREQSSPSDCKQKTKMELQICTPFPKTAEQKTSPEAESPLSSTEPSKSKREIVHVGHSRSFTS